MPALFAAARTAQDLAVRAPFGLSLIFLNVLLEQLGLPVPAIPTLVVAGALAANGQLPLIGVCGLAVAACFIGDSTWYLAGRRYGARVMKLPAASHSHPTRASARRRRVSSAGVRAHW